MHNDTLPVVEEVHRYFAWIKVEILQNKNALKPYISKSTKVYKNGSTTTNYIKMFVHGGRSILRYFTCINYRSIRTKMYLKYQKWKYLLCTMALELFQNNL